MKHNFFKKLDGSKVNPISHTLKILQETPYCEIHVGTDSQNHGPLSRYVTAIAYRYGHNGVHYVYNLNSVPRISDIWTKLWGETERSIEIAEYLRNNIPGITINIDMDFNSDENFDSNKLIAASKGWATSLGYKVNVKPDNQIATRAADYQCR